MWNVSLGASIELKGLEKNCVIYANYHILESQINQVQLQAYFDCLYQRLGALDEVLLSVNE